MKFLIAMLSLVTLAACAPQRESGTRAPNPLTTKYTGATDANGNKHTSYQSVEQKALFEVARQVRANADRTQEQETSAPKAANTSTLKWSETTLITEVKMDFPSESTAKWTLAISDKGKTEHVEFNGPLKETSEGKFATSKSAQGLNSDLVCSSASCNHVAILIYENGELIGSVGIIRESRKVKVLVAASTHKQFESLSEELKPFLKPDVQFEITVSSIEAYPGVSRVQLTKGELFDLQGDLVQGDGSCVRMNGSGLATSIGAFCLAGNDGSGNIALQLSGTLNGQSVRYWFDILPRDDKPADQPNLDTLLASQEVHPLMVKVVPDFNNPHVRAAMEGFWLGGNSHHFSRFMSLFEESLKAESTGEAADFRKMIGIIAQRGFPLVMSFVTLVESTFRNDVCSPKGACGYWQFMPGTAKRLGLSLSPIDERRQIEPSTSAALSYYQELLSLYTWGDDLKMAMAAYNMGEGCTSDGRGLTCAVRRLEQRAQGPGEPKMSLQEVAEYSRNFWNLRERNMIPAETREYVVRILSAMALGTQPQQNGLSYREYPLN